jgi:hypothetical protein
MSRVEHTWPITAKWPAAHIKVTNKRRVAGTKTTNEKRDRQAGTKVTNYRRVAISMYLYEGSDQRLKLEEKVERIRKL